MVHRFLILFGSIAYAVGELWAWARGNRRRVRVSGASMVPTLRDGDDILMKAVTPFVGDVVVANHPDPSRSLLIVKRLESTLPTGALVLRSDNPNEGTDSRTFGPIGAESILGVATLRLNTLRSLRSSGASA